MMRLKSQIDTLFRPLIGQKAWGASVGYGSFVTIEFGRKRLYHGHYHGEWHVWLYLCEWKLFSGARQLADFESKKRMMPLTTPRPTKSAGCYLCQMVRSQVYLSLGLS